MGYAPLTSPHGPGITAPVGDAAAHDHTPGSTAGQVNHSDLIGSDAPDAHHFQQHSISGADHTGTIALAQLPGGALTGTPAPADQSLIGWTVDPAGATSTLAITLGTIYYARIPIRRQALATRLRIVVTGAGTTPTASQCWMGIFTSAGVLIAKGEMSGIGTGEQSATWTAALVNPPYVYAGLVVNAAGAPTLLRGSFVNAGTNWGTTGTGFRGATGGTSQTDLATFTLASNAAGSCLVMGLD